MSVTDTALNNHLVKENMPYGEGEGGDTMFVNIQTDRGILQFTAYNRHNGYYGHRAVVSCNQLDYEDYL